MTTLIPNSWELPSYLAGDLVPMDKYRRRDRVTERADGDWENIGDAQVVDFQKAKRYLKNHPKPAPEPTRPMVDWSQIEPFDPDKHGIQDPADLYSQDSLDALHAAGFEPQEEGVWHRPVTTEEGDSLGAGHTLIYHPGLRRSSDNTRAPWHLMTDPDMPGEVYGSLREAITAADADREQIRRMPKHSRLNRVAAGRRSPGRRDAERWLAENPDFDNEEWMRAREGDPDEGYTEWHPSGSDYSYSDFGDAAGQRFYGDESHSRVLPGSHYDWEEEEDQPDRTDEDEEGDGEDDYEVPEHEQHLADLGFNWQHRGDPNTTPVGEHQEGEYVRGQHDPEGNYIATHTIYRDPNTNRWHLETEPADTPGFVERHTEHQFPDDAISQYHQNASEALLPRRGYEPHRGRTGWTTHWTRTDVASDGSQYDHEISYSEPGFLGQTFADHMNQNYAPNGARNNHDYDLANLVREQDRVGRGMHPGGTQDHRLSPDELKSDPSVARLGNPVTTHMHHQDGKVDRMWWQLPRSDTPLGLTVNADYNWDKGGYDFKYTHGGTVLAPTHNYVPEGAPIHVPGRQTSIPLEGS